MLFIHIFKNGTVCQIQNSYVMLLARKIFITNRLTPSDPSSQGRG